eukprot:2717078-Pleurochrysis_carterae.AAC.1
MSVYGRLSESLVSAPSACVAFEFTVGLTAARRDLAALLTIVRGERLKYFATAMATMRISSTPATASHGKP